jgi:hypothetical protein
MTTLGIPPTQLVDRSYSAYKRTRARDVGNPTNAVGGSFILSLQEQRHARRWDSPQHRLVGHSYSAKRFSEVARDCRLLNVHPLRWRDPGRARPG